MNDEDIEKPAKISPAPTVVGADARKAKADDPATRAKQQAQAHPTARGVSIVEEKLREMTRNGHIILITGHAAAGKTFSVVQAQNEAVKGSYAIGEIVKLIDGVAMGANIDATKDVQAIQLKPTGDNRFDKRKNLYLIDVPGEFFDIAKGRAKFAETDDVRIRQLAACACAADGMILVLPGPAALNMRNVAAPAFIDGPTSMTDEEWKRQNQDVKNSLDLLPHLSHLMQAVAVLQNRSNLDRIGAFQAFCKLEINRRVALPKGGGRSEIPLFVLLTKADQVFGLEPGNTMFKPEGYHTEIDGSDPWTALITANLDRRDRSPTQSFIENFEVVNIDYSSACPGGAKEITTDSGKPTFEIPFNLAGWNVWEPIRWLLERITERKKAGLDTARLGWLSWERWRQIPKIMLLKDRVVARYGGPASVLRIAKEIGDLGKQ